VPEYTVLAVAAAVVVVAVEFGWWRTGLLRSPSYWASLGIALAFMVPVNGWLTKLSDPVVRYDADRVTGWRFPWDIPVEDFVFGIALLTLVLLRWVRVGHSAAPPAAGTVGRVSRRARGRR
jgi:lycopene cyclase domain-containing protein